MIDKLGVCSLLFKNHISASFIPSLFPGVDLGD